MRYKRKGFELTADEIKELEERREMARKEKDYKLSNKIRGILLVGRDRIIHEKVAHICEVDVRTLRDWLASYREAGIGGLKDMAPPGRPCRISQDEKNELAGVIETGPVDSGFDTGIWTSPIICELIKRRFGITYSDSRVRRLMYELGFSFQYPKKKFHGANKEAQASWVKKELPCIKKKGDRRKRNTDVRG